MCCSNFSFLHLHVSHSISNVLAKLIRDVSTNFNPLCLHTLHLSRAAFTVSCVASQFTIRCGAEFFLVWLLFSLFLSCLSGLEVKDMMMITTHVVSDLWSQIEYYFVRLNKALGVLLISCAFINLIVINFAFQINQLYCSLFTS